MTGFPRGIQQRYSQLRQITARGKKELSGTRAFEKSPVKSGLRMNFELIT